MTHCFKRTLLIPFLLLFVQACGNCEGDRLTSVCPAPEPCIIQGSEIVYGSIKNIKLKGTCRFGVTACDETNKVTSCDGYIGPSEEVCDLIDNDCDGKVDEGFDEDFDGFASCAGDCNDFDSEIYPGHEELCNNRDDNCDSVIDNFAEPCYTGYIGSVVDAEPAICKSGKRTCTKGRWQTCRDQVLPKDFETCNGLDDDCDGEVDEIELNHCGPQEEKGTCQKGNQICAGTEALCIDAVYPTEEKCNGADDDCDGAVDEGVQRICQTACGVGVEYCAEGNFIGCTAPRPQPEVCDGIDNDCDGEVDPGCPCAPGMAAVCKENIIFRDTGEAATCGLGVKVCDSDGAWGTCYYFGLEPEQCNNWDDDCDGLVDGMAVTCGDTTLAGIGECRIGTSTCTAGIWSQCDGEVPPTFEVCDSLDNDCDGEVDEDLDPHERVDIMFVVDGSGSMCGKVLALQNGLLNYVNEFAGTDHRFGMGVYPGFNHLVDVLIPLSDFSTFNSSLFLYNCNYGGFEPGYDAAYETTDPLDPMMLGWRTTTSTVEGAYPYVVVITDESPAQGTNTEADVTSHTTACAVGACVPGDKWEIYVITHVLFFHMWNVATFNEPERIINIYPADSDRYTDVLRGIFTNVCR